MLDDLNVLRQHDPEGALEVACEQCEQASYPIELHNSDHDGRRIDNVVIAGMGGSALAALLAKTWLKSDMSMPLEIVRTYDLPNYVNEHTLVIASSYSGNTEETISCLEQAETRRSQVGIIAAGGKLVEHAQSHETAYALLPSGIQPRMGVIYNLRALVTLLADFDVISSDKLDEIGATTDWLKSETSKWAGEVPTEQNYAKQLAMQAVGKTGLFFGGTLTSPLAYKWKISWNENAKNVAFWNELPEFNHNEFIGWTSHPVEKPFAVFDIVSHLEHPQILKRFEISDRLLSGKRPKSTVINVEGDTLIKQLLWGSILADFVSIYISVLNGVDPTPVPLIEKLKKELVA